MSLTRRTFVLLSGGAPLIACRAGAESRDGEAADWPAWAPTRRALYARIARQVKAEGKDIRSFGARLDGVADDTAAMERALAEGVGVIVIPGGPGKRMRLTRTLAITRPVTIAGVGGRPVLSVENPGKALFEAAPPGDDATRFVHDVRLDNLAFDRPPPLRAHGKALDGYNLRGVSVTRCTATRMGLLGVHHMHQKLGRYRRSRGTRTVDPAVLAGFSANDTDDLCEDALVYDCRIDALTHSSQLARFDFTRRIAVAHCTGRFASVSWWGGGARRDEGGDLAFLRRARDIYVCDNVLSGSIGGVYGNNGQSILVARNHVSMVTDVGIDFEGCMDARAAHNVVENAGNYCYATFYAAKNVVFEDNVAVQDGSATNIHLQYGARRIGGGGGRTMFALRSAGFGNVDGAVTVAYRNNRFAWRGADGVGNCLASYFQTLDLTGNRFENVRCGMAYRSTRRLVMRGNYLTFTARDLPAQPLLGGSGGEMAIVGNTLAFAAPPPEGAAAILALLSDRTRSVQIADNVIVVPGETAEIEVRGHARDRGEGQVSVTGNRGIAVILPQERMVTVSRNRGRGDIPAAIRRVPIAAGSPQQPADAVSPPAEQE